MKKRTVKSKKKTPTDSEKYKRPINHAPDNLNPAPHEKNTAHLCKPWKPGQSGNPNGRPPKEKCIPDILRRFGNQPAAPKAIQALKKYYPRFAEKIDNMTGLEVILLRTMLDAQHGDRYAREFIADRTEGKIKQPLDLGFDAFKVQAVLNAAAESAPEPSEEVAVDGNNNLPQ